MELIVITHPEMLPGEAAIINQLFEHGLARLHVRKPEDTHAELHALLEQIDPQFRERIALHQHHELAGEFGISGLHFTEQKRLAQHSEDLEDLKTNGFIISTSIHNPADLEALPHCFDYAFLGPVFDSISKENHKAAMTNDFQLDRSNFPGKLIALGGIDETKLDTVASLGFDGAGVLGMIWMDTAKAVQQFQLLTSARIEDPGLKPGDERTGNAPRLRPGFRERGRPEKNEADRASEDSSNISSDDDKLPHHPGVESEQQHSKTKAIHCPRFQPGDPKQMLDGDLHADLDANFNLNSDSNPDAYLHPNPDLNPNRDFDLNPDLNPETDFDPNPDIDIDLIPNFDPNPTSVPANKAAFIDRLHFISNETSSMSHIDSIRLALEAGCRWIQLRVKNRPEEEVLRIAWEAIRLCDSYGARLIINDFPRVAQAVEAYGLHLGLMDMPVPQARALVGESMIIGGTANTWEDIELRVGEGADYIGLGPFRFTSTKQNLSPVLGIGGYTALMHQMQKAGHATPIIAIGGITPDDIGELRAAGLHGVAMSGALIGATDPQKTFYQIQQALC